MSGSNNRVELSGKVTKSEGLRYTPSGVAICDFKIAVLQECFERKSTGYFEAQLTGALAEDIGPLLKTGKKVSINGELWMRTFRPKSGGQVNEIKVLVKSIQMESERKEK